MGSTHQVLGDTVKLIALYSSRPQMGKSTVAYHLGLRHGFYRQIFAASLKTMIHALLDPILPIGTNIDAHINGDKKETPIDALGGITARRMMQTLGTEWGRGLDPDLWVRIMEARLLRFSNCGVVVDDMRFPNEFDSMRRLGATLVRVTRAVPNLGVLHPHASEGALDQHAFDVTIANDGTLQDLYTQVDKLVNS